MGQYLIGTNEKKKNNPGSGNRTLKLDKFDYRFPQCHPLLAITWDTFTWLGLFQGNLDFIFTCRLSLLKMLHWNKGWCQRCSSVHAQKTGTELKVTLLRAKRRAHQKVSVLGYLLWHSYRAHQSQSHGSPQWRNSRSHCGIWPERRMQEKFGHSQRCFVKTR